jgi:hypothetical protein
MSEQLKEGYYVRIAGSFYKIIGVEPFQYETGNESTPVFTSVAVGSDSGWVNMTTMEPDEKPQPRLFQAWFGVRDGCQYFFKIPSGTNRFGVDEDKDIGFIDNELSPMYNPNKQYETWLIHDYYPSILAKNGTDATVIPRILFTGFKYDIEKVYEGTPIYDSLLNERTPSRPITLGGLKV